MSDDAIGGLPHLSENSRNCRPVVLEQVPDIVGQMLHRWLLHAGTHTLALQDIAGILPNIGPRHKGFANCHGAYIPPCHTVDGEGEEHSVRWEAHHLTTADGTLLQTLDRECL